MDLFWCGGALYFCLLLVFAIYVAAGSQQIGQIYPGFEAAQMEYIDKKGLFLLSNNSIFGFGFLTALDVRLFVLIIMHISSGKIVWTANRYSPISGSDKFVFDKNGNVYLRRSDGVVWSTNTSGARVKSMELWDSGNLVLLGDHRSVIWQSFSHPTDTLLPGQDFLQGMMLRSFPNGDNMSVYLEFMSGDLVLYAGYQNPQIYWSLANYIRSTTNRSLDGKVHSATLVSSAWNFYDQNKALLWQFNISENSDRRATWAAILGYNEAISFHNLRKGRFITPEAIRIPEKLCSVPEPCGPFFVCYFETRCQCPTPLWTRFNCKPPIASTCTSTSSKNSAELFYVGEKLYYFALDFVTPFSRNYDLDGCKEACLHNCSCSVLFFENETQSCFLFDQIGSLRRSQDESSGYMMYVKISTGSHGPNSTKQKKIILASVFIVAAAILVIAGLLYLGFWYYRKKKRSSESPQENSDEDGFADSSYGLPVRFSYNELCEATKRFSTKLGQGGFGSVYLGVLQDGTRLAVKKLESIGQGKKQFRAEITIIGRVHHVHLVKLKGFCMEKAHRLLVYEYMGNKSLDKWIFKTSDQEETQLLTWNARFNIALGTAKGLAYLHEECEVKIVHCDIKPENVLLDDNFTAKVSDFGLAKLMNREDSLVYTTLRGTRGYLAPEWITNSPISEKTDVYSYGVVLFEIIGGRRSYDMVDDGSENGHFPTYAFKMLEEGRLREILDPRLDMDENDHETVETAIKVALWCVQDDMNLRPPMTKVVQMLEGLCTTPQPATPSQLSTARANYSGFFKWSSEQGGSNSSRPRFDNSDALLSDIHLSGPR